MIEQNDIKTITRMLTSVAVMRTLNVAFPVPANAGFAVHAAATVGKMVIANVITSNTEEEVNAATDHVCSAVSKTIKKYKKK